MSDISVLIVDDEPAARRGLHALLAAEKGLVVVGEAGDGRSAVSSILGLRPDVVFLDIQMPELNGFEVLEAIAGEVTPIIVFVTAYDEWAVRAFEVRALDYILKPFEDHRLRSVVQRIRSHIAMARPAELAAAMQSLLAERRAQREFLTRLIVREAGIVQFVDMDDVDWIEAADYYVRLHMKGRTQLVRYTLNDLERQLDPRCFVRVHRSAIVSIKAVQSIRIAHQQHHTVVLNSGQEVPLSRSKKEVLENEITKGTKGTKGTTGTK